MEVKSCKVIYFSPTDTTKKILNSIVEGLNIEEVDVLNLNKYDRAKKENIIIDSDIVIMGAPVYGERIADEASKVFEKIEGAGKAFYNSCCLWKYESRSSSRTII